jgi:hypothetical protein
MTTLIKRLNLFALLMLALVFILYGSNLPARATVPLQATPDVLPTTQPAIIGTLNGTPVEGTPGSFCWPQADGTPLCDFVDDPQPTTPITVANGDAIVFTVDPASPAPQTLRGTLLDDKNADGDVLETDLTATGGVYTIQNLSDGTHRLQIDALYPGTEQSQPFVAYVFLLQVGVSSSAPVATPEVVGEVTPTETTPEPVATEPAPADATPVVEATAAATEQVAQPVATQPSIVEPTVVPPTIAPTVAPPTATPLPLPTNVPTTVPVTDGGITATIPIPPVRLIVGGRRYEAIAINACAVGSTGETICINRPAQSAVLRIEAASGDAAQVDFGGPRPTAFVLTFYTADGTKVLSKQEVRPDNLVLYNLPTNAGNYVVSAEISFPDGKATYYFQLAIS